MNLLVETEIVKLSETLNRLGNQYLPRAVADALNAPARLIAVEAKKRVVKDLIVRTPYTTNSIRQFGTAKGTNIRRMYSMVGSNSDYLDKHDEGEVVKAKRSYIPIPMLTSRTGKNIRKSIRSKYRMNRMGSFASSPTFFDGVPKGKVKGKTSVAGIYERYSGNKKLRLLRTITAKSVKIPETKWYTKTLLTYGNEDVIFKAFRESAQKIIDEVSLAGFR